MLDENTVVGLVNRGIINDTFRRLPLEKKNRVYQTAISLLGEYGYDGLSVDRFCPAAGISKGSFFQYFPSKSHLLEFVILAFDDYLARWMAAIRRDETAGLARDRLRHLYDSLVTDCRLTGAEQRFYLFIINALPHAGVVLEGIDLDRHIGDYILDIVERGERTGEIRGDFRVQLTTYLVTLFFDALARRQFSGEKTPHAQVADYWVSFLFDGIKR